MAIAIVPDFFGLFGGSHGGKMILSMASLYVVVSL